MNSIHKLKVGDRVKLFDHNLYGTIECLVYSPLHFLAYDVRWTDGENPVWIEQQELDCRYEEELEQSK